MILLVKMRNLYLVLQNWFPIVFLEGELQLMKTMQGEIH